MFCTNCGQKLSDTAKFCTGCGAKIDRPEPEAETPVVEPKAVAEEIVAETEVVAEENVVKPENAALEEPTAETQEVEVEEPISESETVAGKTVAEPAVEATAEPTAETREETVAEPEFQTEPKATAETGKKSNGKLIAIIAALVVVVLVGVFMMLPKGEKADDDEYAFAAKLEQVESEDYSDLCQYQINLLDDLKYEIIEFSEDGDLDNAQAYYDKFYAYIEAFRNPGQAALAVKQVDASDFPNVKVYFTLTDPNTGEALEDLDSELFYIMEMAEGEGNFVTREILNASQLNLSENLNISMVADVSGSMAGDRINDAKSVMFDFIDTVQFNVGDKVSFISFADTVNAEIPFTSNAKLLKNTVASLDLQNMTAFYDALYVALNQIIGEEGAKCVIAFTDGEDNYSQCTPESVVSLATKYNIPIYIIGIGDSIDINAKRIAEATGGEYTNITTADRMEQIYNEVYKAQKEMYVIEYVSGEEFATDVARNLGLGYIGSGSSGHMEYMYTPSVLLEGTTAADNVNTGEFIFPDSDVRYITAADLAQLTEWELRIARNEIYARKGRMFQDQKLQDYFNSTSWYNGTIPPDQFTEALLNEVEKANAYFIRSYENMNGFN